MVQDLRFGLRMLLKRKGFTLVAVLTLALGIGANTAIFSVINAVLLRGLPFADAGRIVMIWETHPAIPRVDAPIPDFEDWRAQARSFDEMAVHADRLRNGVLIGQTEPVQIQGTYISQNLFPLLGLKPVLGRNFLPEEEQRDKNHVVILSQAIWRQSFAGDPSIIGKSIRINDGEFTVVGVMSEQYPLEMDVWLPLTHLDAKDFTMRSNHRVSVIGRLKTGSTIEQARREMIAIASRLRQLYPDTNKNIGVELLPLRNQLVGDLRPVMLLVFSSVALVLLIACANVSNLLLAQAAGRRRELALRAALGAGRGRLMRQILVESLLLALLGGVAGLLLAKACMPFLRAELLEMASAKIPGLDAAGIDPATLGFSFVVSVLTAVLFGAAPMLQFSRVDLNQVLKEGGKTSSGIGQRTISRMLIVGEVALAVVVLVGAGLLLRSFQQLVRVDPGFRVDHLLSLKIDLPQIRYPHQKEIDHFYQRLISSLQTLPGVQQATVINHLSFTPTNGPIEVFSADGHFPEPGRDPIMQMRTVDRGFFDLMRIPLRRGRLFNDTEAVENPSNFILINETMARRYFPNQDPVGGRISMRGPRAETIGFPIIGVVADIKDLGLDAPVEPEIYFPGRDRKAVLLLRTTVEPSSLAATVRKAALSIDPALPLPTARSVEENLSLSLARRRLAAGLLSLFALSALALTVIGVYGVTAYSVMQRTQEIGIRMALGAQASDVIKLVLGHGVAPVMVGLSLGLAGAFALTRSLASLTTAFLFDIRAADPVTYCAIALVLPLTALLACLIPARRAAQVDPMVALKHE